MPPPKKFRPFSCTTILISVFFLLLLQGCHRHYRPIQNADPETGIVKRQLNTDGSYYVRPGDTLYAIAFSYGLDPMDVAQLNGISSPFTIYPGQKLKLTGSSAGQGSTEPAGVKVAPAKAPGQVTTKTVKSPVSSTRAESTPGKAPVVSTSPGAAKESSSKTAPAGNKADPTSWKWPTDGRVIRSFIAGDPARNGLDITGKEGQAITASSGGQVVYSGNGLIGYGELIIVKHSEKMLSAYAHNRVRLVKEGDQVWAGQKIAEMGRNSSNEPLLHFEIRAMGKPVNPMNYLPAR